MGSVEMTTNGTVSGRLISDMKDDKSSYCLYIVHVLKTGLYSEWHLFRLNTSDPWVTERFGIKMKNLLKSRIEHIFGLGDNAPTACTL
jgi:hypothetical protein